MTQTAYEAATTLGASDYRRHLKGLFVACAGCALGFLSLAALLHLTRDTVPSVDREVFVYVQSHFSSEVGSLLRSLGRLGATEYALPSAAVVVFIIAISRRSPCPVVVFWVGYTATALITSLFKHLLNRPEPFDRAGDVGLSYPSGHVSQAVVIYGVLFVLVAPYRWRAVARIAAGVAIVIVVSAVMYRSTHWLTDVIGAGLLGVACLCLGLLAGEVFDKVVPWRSLVSSVREVGK